MDSLMTIFPCYYSEYMDHLYALFSFRMYHPLLMPFNFTDIMSIPTLDHKLDTFLITSLGSTSVQLLDQRVRT